MSMRADLVILDGRVLTQDEAMPRAEAVAVRNGTIQAVGSRADIAGLAGNETRVIDAGGGTVLPGFIESHMHLFSGAVSLGQLQLTRVQGFEALEHAVREFAGRRPGRSMLVAGHANYGMLGSEPITRHHLDRILPDRPFAMVTPDAHTVWANTRALEMAELLRGGDVGVGSEIVMGEDGLATGELRESGAFGPVLALSPTGGRESLGYVTGADPVPPATPAERATDRTALQRGLDYCASLGITSIHNMDGNTYQLERLKEIDEERGLACRVQIPFLMKNDQPLTALEDAREMHERYRSPFLYSGRVKLYMDGVLDSWTGFLLGAYADDSSTDGDPLFDAGHFAEIAVEADRLGLQIAVHAIGDAAVQRTLDGYEAARFANGLRDARHRIEHIELCDPTDLPRFKALGVIASVQPLHALGTGGFPSEPTLTRIGRERYTRAYPWRALRDAGARMAFSSDWPVSPVDPMLSFRAAMLRTSFAPGVPDNRQTLAETIAGYTSGGAYAEKAEARKGRLKAGMFADIVVLSRDLEATDPEEFPVVRPLATICGGRITYEA